MQEKVRLLMEETGCEQGEAELALELADNDLEKAIKTIGSLLRHLFALKGKVCFRSRNLYGMLLIVVNAKTQEILRLRAVVSYNPGLYENAPQRDWYSLEKLIYSYRLDEGSLPDFTREVEERMQSGLLAKRDALQKCDPALLSGLLGDLFAPEKAEVHLVVEELNLAQFRHLPGSDFSTSSRATASENETGVVWLNVELVEDGNGRDAGRLVEGEVVLASITDTRDIAHYLAHLIGGKREGDMIPLPAAIRKVVAGKDETEVHIYFAPGIVGVAKVHNGCRVQILETRTQPWWKRIIPWT